MGEGIHLNVTETAKRVFKGVRRMRLLTRLRLTATLAKKAGLHYSNYPETPEKFEDWRAQTEALFEEARTKIMR
jgi:hypothetical protein